MTEQAHPADAPGAVTTYTVSGMTCDHCVRAVREEITAMVPQVRDVRVELDTGAVTVVSDTTPDDATVRAAVEEAGYELVAGP